MYGQAQLRWDGDQLRLISGRELLKIEPDQKYPRMWRVRMPDGRLSIMVNRTRAKDAAQTIALSFLNARETRREEAHVASNAPPLVRQPSRASRSRDASRGRGR
jgi:hypothetical protein